MPNDKVFIGISEEYGQSILDSAVVKTLDDRASTVIFIVSGFFLFCFAKIGRIQSHFQTKVIGNFKFKRKEYFCSQF